MRYRRLTHSGIQVSEIGFGAWGIGGGWGPQDDDSALTALQMALDRGVTFLDTALGYGGGHSEELIGRAVKGRRDQVVIASKVPPKTFQWPVLPDEPLDQTFPAEWIRECTEQSLRHLDTEYLDLQQLHAWTPAYLDQTEWYEALVRLKEQGKIRAFGVSANDWDPYGPVELAKAGRVDTIQVIYNLFEQRPAEALLPAAQAAGVGIIVRVPFEEGLLTGKMTPETRFPEGDWRADWLTPERLAEAWPRVQALRGFLSEDAPTLPALALKFCLSHPAVSTVIPGMRRPEHVESNLAASDGKPLSPDTLRSLALHSFTHGWSYPWAQRG
ncbi:MAG TPA: aldo/keto reductase [Armatimonadota bacterium]|jgi:aryl-alcohol dehydrogenase-like predicted oxidoreductase